MTLVLRPSVPRLSRGRRLALLVLLLAASVGALAYADRPRLRQVGRALATMRDSSMDKALEAKVKSALALSRRVSGMSIDVLAHSGTVTLAGRVPTQDARSIAEAITLDTPGVLGVDNRLVVDPKAITNPYERSLLDRIADLETQVSLQERLRREPLLASSNVRVEVEGGVVSLRGWVKGDLERTAARNVADKAVGHDHVRDELETLGGTGASGDRLGKRVEFELYSTGAFDLSRIHVRSEAGRVDLEGSVRSEAERLLAARVAEDVPGVHDVVNGLSLSEEAAGHHGEGGATEAGPGGTPSSRPRQAPGTTAG